MSNANPFDTFRTMLDDRSAVAEYEARWQQYSVSLSCFQVFLGLKTDLVRKLGIEDSEIFIEASYDPEAAYARALSADVESGGLGVTLSLYLAGAWSRPGHGYGAVIPSGLECFAEIVSTW